MAKHIFVTGGVASGLGKGMTAASLGRLLKDRGLKVTAQKLDPYMNSDPGKINPLEHGEVYVLKDGCETDLDLGHYERFIDEDLTTYNITTSGKVYSKLLKNEEALKYSGKTIQIVPHITDETKRIVYECAKKSGCDVLITEIGGTVGDIESMAFLEAIRQIGAEKGRNNCLFIHVALVPYIKASGEHKSKPTQHSVQQLQGLGITPNIVIARADEPIDDEVLDKISRFCGIKRDCIIQNVTLPYVYELPLYLHDNKLDDVVCRELKLKTPPADLTLWTDIVDRIKNRDKVARIALVGKYVDLRDSYLSVLESMYHAGIKHGAKIDWKWVNSINLTESNVNDELEGVDGILVPGAFGKNGAEGIVLATKYARERDIPYLGICMGMHVTTIDFARNVLGLEGANSTELDAKTKYPVVHMVNHADKLKAKDGTMRIGALNTIVKSGTKLHEIYGADVITERHRHRYEVNMQYVDAFVDNGLVISGYSEFDGYIDAMENPNNKFFVAVQFHPEFMSRPNRPHPLFAAFLEASLGAQVSE